MRAVVVGAGAMGRRHAQRLQAHPSVKLLGIMETDSKRQQTLCSELSVVRLCQLPVCELVIFATPPLCAHRLIDQALAQGAKVLLEKPVLVELSSFTDRVAVGHIERFNPLLKRVGLPKRITRVGNAPQRSWSVGPLLDLAVHDLDWLRWRFGEVTLSNLKRRGELFTMRLAVKGEWVHYEVGYSGVPRRCMEFEGGQLDLLKRGPRPDALDHQLEALIQWCSNSELGGLASYADAQEAVQLVLEAEAATL